MANKKSRTQNRSIVILALAVATVLLGSLAWISANNTTSMNPVAATSQLITPGDYQAEFGDGVEHLLLDVRTPEEFLSGHITGSVNINVETLPSRLNEIPKDIPVVVYCRSGNRSARAATILVEAGYSPIYDLGGIQAWVAEGYSIQ